MEDNTTIRLDGRFLYYAFIAGGTNIVRHQYEINKINVFPVKDNDTGSNLASTVRSVFYTIKPSRSYKSTLNDIAKAALMGARGNSGLIFAQFLYGVNCATLDKAQITFSEFATSIEKSIPYIYKAVARPVEGTMLTVIRRWSDFLIAQQHSLANFYQILCDSMFVLKDALRETKNQLTIMQRNNCEDAGAKGFVLFIEGIISFIKNGKIRDLDLPEEANSSMLSVEESTEKITFRYCTEAILTDVKCTLATLNEFIQQWGDSIVVAGGQSLCRIHLHTDTPDLFFDALHDKGVVTYQKVDDMVHQNEIATSRKWDIALVTDSACDLSQELIDRYQIHVVPLNIYFGERHYLDKVTVQPNQFYNMLEESNTFPQTAQINEQTFVNLYSYLTSHYKEVIAVHLTDQFSGTYLNSVKAAKKIEKESSKPIHVINSKNLSGGLGLLVLRIAEAIEQGKTTQYIMDNVEQWSANTSIFVSVRNLKYMLRGGRVSSTVASLVRWIGINPIVSMDKIGKAKLFGYTLSQQSNVKRIVCHIEKLSRSRHIWNYIVLHSHNPEGAQAFQKQMETLYNKPAISIVDISPVIGMNAGPGAIAISLQVE